MKLIEVDRDKTTRKRIYKVDMAFFELVNLPTSNSTLKENILVSGHGSI
ncbi:MAG: hypothetical protein IPL26_13405 [Leptospiraceae bacterium]|nr:hypothetical protein [Leptospiraceae bacterium]